MTTVEICTEDVDGPAAAQAGGAHRVELCAALSEGGVTPTLSMVSHARRTAPGVALQVLIRPRGGDFVYSPDELAVMREDIRVVREALPDHDDVGFTLGALSPDGDVDVAAMTVLMAACGSAPVTFHKAFDTVPDQRAAVDLLADLGVGTILTAGGPGAASQNLAALADLVGHAAGRIAIMVGGGVRAHNAAAIVGATGAPALHLRAGRERASSSRTGSSQYDRGLREVTSPEVVADVVTALGEQVPA